MPTSPLELSGLRVELDKLVYRHGAGELPPATPHAFIYYLTVRNDSPHTVHLLARKWIVEHADGTRLVIEGDKIVGETPQLSPGQSFSYNSYHVTSASARAHGGFHGLDDLGRRIWVRIPPIDLKVPQT